MRSIVVSTQSILLSDAIIKGLRETSEFHPERILPDRSKDTVRICKGVNAEVLLMEVTRVPQFSLESRKSIIRELNQELPECKIVLLCDEISDGKIAESVKEMKKTKEIEAFFYSSVSRDYLIAALDSL